MMPQLGAVPAGPAAPFRFARGVADDRDADHTPTTTFTLRLSSSTLTRASRTTTGKRCRPPEAARGHDGHTGQGGQDRRGGSGGQPEVCDEQARGHEQRHHRQGRRPPRAEPSHQAFAVASPDRIRCPGCRWPDGRPGRAGTPSRPSIRPAGAAGSARRSGTGRTARTRPGTAGTTTRSSSATGRRTHADATARRWAPPPMGPPASSDSGRHAATAVTAAAHSIRSVTQPRTTGFSERPARTSRRPSRASFAQPTDSWPVRTARNTSRTPAGPRPRAAATAVIAAVTAMAGPGWQPRSSPRTGAEPGFTACYPATRSTMRVNVRGIARAAGTIIGRAGPAPTRSRAFVVVRYERVIRRHSPS